MHFGFVVNLWRAQQRWGVWDEVVLQLVFVCKLNLRGWKDKGFICDDAEGKRSQQTTYIDPSVVGVKEQMEPLGICWWPRSQIGVTGHLSGHMELIDLLIHKPSPVRLKQDKHQHKPQTRILYLFEGFSYLRLCHRLLLHCGVASFLSTSSSSESRALSVGLKGAIEHSYMCKCSCLACCLWINKD